MKYHSYLWQYYIKFITAVSGEITGKSGSHKISNFIPPWGEFKQRANNAAKYLKLSIVFLNHALIFLNTDPTHQNIFLMIIEFDHLKCVNKSSSNSQSVQVLHQ